LYNPLTEKHDSMRMFSRLLLLVFLCLIFAANCVASSNCTGGNNIQPQPQAAKQKMAQLIIKFRKADFDPSRIEYVQELSRDAQTQMVYLRPMSGGAHVFRVVDISDNRQLTAVIQRLSERPEILYIEQDRIMQHQKVQ
jgi:hypothetical protein